MAPPRKQCLWAAAVYLLAGGILPAQADAPASEKQSPLRPYRVVVGFRTSVSGGDMSLDKLARQAKTAGIDGVMLSDRLSRQLQYGLPPLRYLLWFAFRKPSVSTMGPSRYIESVRALNRTQKDVCFVPGVKVAPGYYWTGSLLGDLQCHNYHREILMLGTQSPEPLLRLPYAAGYVPGRDGLWLFAARFLLLLCVALWVGYYYVPAWVRHRFRIRRRKTKSVYFVFFIVPSLVVVAFFNIVAGGVRRFHIHGPPEGMSPEQGVLNRGAEAGFFQMWSHPQEGVENYRWPVSFVTPPYREVITLTHSFNAFSCFSASGPDLYAPGQVWDRLLLDFIEQVAPYPIWTVGDLLDPKKLVDTPAGMVDNVVFAREKSPGAFLTALETGRFYCRRRSPTNAIDIKRFTVEGHSFGEQAKTDRSRMEVAFEISSLEPGTPVEVKLVRNGIVLYSFKGVTPFAKKLSDSIDQRTETVYYRITAKGPGRLAAVGQPVFLTYAPSERPWSD
ncbi:MAG: hypothetical protein GXP31_06830 [Kiritimatiellaeota bacterium]|nr:hypothetical protein [Kiritimatiellota bacterium]